ncbi:class I SAM-dependent methyltransferase [Bacillus carboniphilus]|uniref:Class I SAM-dependent methyltransferase n=1 Tax=Bacillus carboniphilus TaxID=86663 RepID=A0ABN0VTT5_9BACI
MSNEKLVRIFDKQAKTYERRRRQRADRKPRENLIPFAKGKVLEVAVGAGANFPYYPTGVEVTGVDFSGEMLGKARVAAREEGVSADFIQSDVETLSFPEHSFDTIVSTLSMCGYEDPVKILNLFNKWCKPGGQILLLEHGISSNRLLGSIQTLLNPVYRRFVGCHFNRDIVQLLQQSDIQIDKIEHQMLGIMHKIWAKPSGTEGCCGGTEGTGTVSHTKESTKFK